jgi:hypothetical protein
MDTEIRYLFTPRTADSAQGVQQSQFLFADSATAHRVFRKLQRDVRQCEGTDTQRIEGDTPADLIEWQSSVTNGTMQAVPGISTVTVNNDWTRAIGGDVNFRQDEFSTYSRVGHAIIRVTYERDPNGTLTPAERRGVRETTRAAVENYRDQRAPKAGSIQARFTSSLPELIEAQDVPSSLGAAKRFRAQDISLASERQRIWLCDPEGLQFSDEGDTAPFIGITASPVQVSSGLAQDGQGGVNQIIMDFSTNKQAARAFTQLRSQAKKCSGTFVEDVSGTGDEDGEPFSGSITRTFSTTESRLVGASPSILISMGLQVQIDDDPTNTSGFYEVLSLSGSQVVWMEFFTDGSVNSKQKKAVQALAVTAVQKVN